jgi:multidrug efflux pump subunit AcrB
MRGTLYQYTVQTGSLEELDRFAPVIEVQMRRLSVIVIKDVSLDPQLKRHQASVNPTVTMTISFSTAPGESLADAIAKINDLERRLALPATIATSVTKAPTESHSR